MIGSKDKDDQVSFTLEKRLAISALLLGFLGQVACIFIIGESEIQHEWRVYLESLLETGTYSYRWDTWGVGWVPSAYMPPLYALYIWFSVTILQPGVQSIHDVSEYATRIIQILQVGMWILSAMIVAGIARTIARNSVTGIWAAALFILFPLALVSPSQITAVNLYMVPFTLLLYLCVKYGYRNGKNGSFRVREAVLLAIVSSILSMGRAEALLYVPIIAFFVIKRGGWRKAFLYLLVISMALSPIIIRNWRALGHPTGITTSGGYNLWRGQKIGEISDELLAKIKNLQVGKSYEVELDKIFRTEALRFMKENPGKVMHRAFEKTAALWLHEPEPAHRSFQYVRLPWYWGPWLIYLALAILGGLILRGEGLRFLGVPLIGVTLTSAIFFILPRYRLHILPVIAVYAAVAVTYFFKRAQKMRIGFGPNG